MADVPISILISSLDDMPAAVRRHRVRALVSIIQAEFQPPTPPGVAAARHHRCAVNDIVAAKAGEVLANAAHIGGLLSFLRQWDGRGPLLAHCFAGVSRSTAVALVAHAMRSGDPAASAAALRRAVPYALPNRHIVALADAALGLGGALNRAREAMGGATALKQPGYVATVPLP